MFAKFRIPWDVGCTGRPAIHQINKRGTKIQSNLGFPTSRSLNNSVFERKIRDENHSVLKQKFGSQTTQEKDLPEPKRQRIEKTPLKLCEVFCVLFCVAREHF